MERLHSPIMTSNFVGLFFILSIGTLVSSAAIDEWIPKAETPLCIKMINGYLSTNETSEKEYYLRAAETTCQPGFKVPDELDKCSESGHFQRLATYQCRLGQITETTNCSVIPTAINCILDLVGSRCGGDEAIVLYAFQMEYQVIIDEAPTYGKCAIDTLHHRQKHPEWRSPRFSTEMDPRNLCLAIEKGDANKTSDPEYYEQRASAILCDGKSLKKFAKETSDCVALVLLGHQARNRCRIRNLDGDICEDQRQGSGCLARLFAKRCGGQPAVEIWAFGEELSLELLREKHKNSEATLYWSECLDAAMAELRALQKPKKDSPTEN